MKTRLNKITPNWMLITTAALCIGLSTGVFAEPFNNRGILVVETASVVSPGPRTVPTPLARGFNDRGVGFIPAATAGSQRTREQWVVTLSGGFNDRGSYFVSETDQHPTGPGGHHIAGAL